MRVIKAADIKPGHWLDLQGDVFADYHRDNSFYESEFAIVDTAEMETPDCVLVTLESGTSIGFPPGHYLRHYVMGD